jgi:TonB family protein
MQSAPGGIEILSDTQGVDFRFWLEGWRRETDRAWKPLIPKEVDAPFFKSGTVAILFKVLPSGRIKDGSMVLEGSSGDVALDRAAWGALTGSSYPPLPAEFHGPYLKLRAIFYYNTNPNPAAGDASPKSGMPLSGLARLQQEPAPATETGNLAVVSTPPKPDKDGVYLPGPGIPAPIVIQRVAAVYPADAPEDAFPEVCVLSMVVGADGVPAGIQVVRSGGASFDAAAIEAVRQSKIAPGTLDGKPVPVRIFVRTRFFADRRIAYPRLLNRYDPNNDTVGFSPRNGVPPQINRDRDYDKPPVATYAPAAGFSDEARRAKIQGIVIVSTLVTEEGLPTDLRVEKSLGYGLDEKALQSVRMSRFKPALKDGEPVAARTTIEINFRLY